MASGKVKWFNNTKGYGFIETDEGNDLFVHFSDVIGEGFRSLEEGQRVVFETQDTEKGPKAVKVTLADMVNGNLKS